jgi:hypothetical protein
MLVITPMAHTNRSFTPFPPEAAFFSRIYFACKLIAAAAIAAYMFPIALIAAVISLTDLPLVSSHASAWLRMIQVPYGTNHFFAV